MTDALSSSSRAARKRRAHEAFLDAMLAFLESQEQDRCVALQLAFEAQYDERQQDLLVQHVLGLWHSTRCMLAGDEQAWAHFIATHVGFDDARRLGTYRELSPFKGCSFVTIERDAKGTPGRVSGEVTDFFAAMRDDTLVETRKFRFRAGTPYEFDFLALHPLLLR